MSNNWIQLAPGVRRQTVAVGEKMMQVLVHFDKGAIVPEHKHVHEQIASVVAGKLRLIVEGTNHDLTEGSFALKSNQPHAAEALEECWVLDTFSPPREDFLEADKKAAGR
ncbi:MAG TPA: cupin domain-containing protein [Tepidisphaeraceae bacterium]|jgi:quercetin dioxygenase-like cupin family protein|nr:cupin domain-containing protein [Tepidisphaeraceae bacterium]